MPGMQLCIWLAHIKLGLNQLFELYDELEVFNNYKILFLHDLWSGAIILVSWGTMFCDQSYYFSALVLYPYFPLSLQLSNYSSFEGVLYCKPHFDQLFKMTGSLDKSFEGNKLSWILFRHFHPLSALWCQILSLFFSFFFSSIRYSKNC